jgi:hypothetical protein
MVLRVCWQGGAQSRIKGETCAYKRRVPDRVFLTVEFFGRVYELRNDSHSAAKFVAAEGDGTGSMSS